MTVYVSELHIFDNGDDYTTFLGSVMASDKGIKELSEFVNGMGDINRSDSAQKPSPRITDAFFMPSDILPRYVITPKCRRVALENGARSLSLALLVNKCADGGLQEAWDEIYPFCV